MPRPSYEELVDSFKRHGIDPLTAEQMQIMYGDIECDLRVEQRALDIARTRAEIDKLKAEAAKDRADAFD